MPPLLYWWCAASVPRSIHHGSVPIQFAATGAAVEERRQLRPFDPGHMPEEILLTDAFYRRFPDLPQVAYFDTPLHPVHEFPLVAQLLPTPRRATLMADLAEFERDLSRERV